MNWDTIQQVLRIGMQLGAGVLLQRGLITEEMATTLTGAVISLGGIGWWLFWERFRTPTTTEVVKLARDEGVPVRVTDSPNGATSVKVGPQA